MVAAPYQPRSFTWLDRPLRARVGLAVSRPMSCPHSGAARGAGVAESAQVPGGESCGQVALE